MPIEIRIQGWMNQFTKWFFKLLLFIGKKRNIFENAISFFVRIAVAFKSVPAGVNQINIFDLFYFQILTLQFQFWQSTALGANN
jgi:hypothetical protein